MKFRLLSIRDWFWPPCPRCSSRKAVYWFRAGAIDCPNCDTVSIVDEPRLATGIEMDSQLLSTAREYIVHQFKSLTISVAGLARAIKCSKDDALACGIHLQGEGLLKISGFVTCPYCEDYTRLTSSDYEKLKAEAKALNGKQCWCCGEMLSDDNKLEVSFRSDV